MTDKPDPKAVEYLVERISPILAGHDPTIQSAVLADLLSMWLAGHMGSPDEIQKFREELLEAHIKLVRDLIPVNEAMILERLRKESS